MKKKYTFAILKNEDPYDHHNWVKACERYANYVAFFIIDLSKATWLNEIKKHSFDCLLAKPGAKTSLFRQLYQERLEILVDELRYNVFPSLNEIKLYENKRFFSYWLQANQLPHPRTIVFYNKQEAMEHICTREFPCVGKMNIGASGDGVVILKNAIEGREYIEKAFSKGLHNRTCPKFFQKNLILKKIQKLLEPKKTMNRLKTYRAIAHDTQFGFVILQDFISHNFEWRVVRIGNSFFAHKKIKTGIKASGSLIKAYENPPQELLHFVKELTDRFGFFSQAVDVFVGNDGNYLINEMQCIFGQSDAFQMKVDENIGRYVYRNSQWDFEKGSFNENASYNLRLKTAIEMFCKGNK